MSAYIKKAFLNYLLAIATVQFGWAQSKTIDIRIDLSKTYQTIDNFGASDAWSCQYAGTWPDAKRRRIAELLFSGDTLDNGSPKGIALSLWRFNIGAGSAEQGEQSGIRDEWRRTESFLDSTGRYNWERQPGQLWFLKAAKAYGVKQLLGFCNSPPALYTLNHKTFADKGRTNISPGRYHAFANYLADVVNGLDRNYKIRLNYISPVNEPQWAWSDGGQEGCPYTNKEIAALVRVIDSAFRASNVSSKIVIGEAGSIDYLYTNNKGGKGNQADDFFKGSSSDHVGGLSRVADIISAHSYFTTSPLSRSVEMRTMLADTISRISGLRFWQSEYCILGDNSGEINGSKRDLGMDAALYMAGVIHNDLTVANASAWQWWMALSPYDYKDGLIYIDKEKAGGNFYPGKMLWALGNYSRFIRPGAVRLSAAIEGMQTTNKPVFVSAYKKGKAFTMVIINSNDDPVRVKLYINSGQISLHRSYVTSETSDLKAGLLEPNGDEIDIAGRSVTSITGIIK